MIGGIAPPAGLAAIAGAAAAALRLEFGGADVMESPGGALTLAEFNFPCFFADQQEATGIDIAGAIIDHLLAKLGEADASDDELRRRGDWAARQ